MVSRLLALLAFASVPVCDAFGYAGPADGDGLSEQTAFRYVGAADGQPEGAYDFWVMTSSSEAKRLPFVVHTLSNGDTRAWAHVYQKLNQEQGLFTPNEFGTVSKSQNFKLSDTEINYMTGDANPEARGAIIVPNYAGGHLTGNLLRASDGNRAYPIGSSSMAYGGHMAMSSLDALEYPSAWDQVLDTNSYCGGTQVWATWTGTEAYQFRLITASGCSYFQTSINGYSGPIDGVLSMFVH